VSAGDVLVVEQPYACCQIIMTPDVSTASAPSPPPYRKSAPLRQTAVRSHVSSQTCLVYLFVISLIEMSGCDWFKSRHVV